MSPDDTVPRVIAKLPKRPAVNGEECANSSKKVSENVEDDSNKDGEQLPVNPFLGYASTSTSEKSPASRPGRQRNRRKESFPIESYTVGWITTWRNDELTTAILMLDEEHDQPDGFEQHARDTNSYHWGRIGNHNVVIAFSLMAHGLVGAATTADALARSHPCLRFGLSVGTGSGIPRVGHDMRLGDVVVGIEKSGGPSCVQYDLMKADGGLKTLAGQPIFAPELLEKAVLRLSALNDAHGLHSGTMPEIMQEVYDKHPGLPESWKYQGIQFDKDLDALYLGNTQFRSQQKLFDPEDLPRETRQPCPYVYYGVIGSGDTLVRSKNERPDIVKRLPSTCLCLDTEAAGIMQSFPCLIIRGIRDYADFVTGDRWTRYAALTAAAYAKELLESMPGKARVPRPTTLDNSTPNKAFVTTVAEAKYLDDQAMKCLLTGISLRSWLPALNLCEECKGNVDQLPGDWDICILKRGNYGERAHSPVAKPCNTEINSENRAQLGDGKGQEPIYNSVVTPLEKIFQFGSQKGTETKPGAAQTCDKKTTC